MVKENDKLNEVNINIFDGNTWIDATNMHAIIYGAGIGCLEMMDAILLPNVERVIDGNCGLWGTSILLLSKNYKICKPESLHDLDDANYYIIVSSVKYYEEIKKDIIDICGDKFLICSWKRDVRVVYRSLNTMMLEDNIIHEKLFRSRMTRQAINIINDYKKIIENIKPNLKIDYYIPTMSGGSKFSFIFGNSEQLWIYHHKGYVNSKEQRIIEREQESIKYLREEYVNDNKLEGLLTVWKGENSLIQIYADNNLDFSNKTLIKKVIKKIKEINSLPLGKLPNFDFIKTFFDDNIQKIEKSSIGLEKKNEIIRKANAIAERNSRYIAQAEDFLCVVHGDLVYDNIVSYNNELIFIDWEYVSIGFPEIDICYFLYSVNLADYKMGRVSYISMCEKCFEDIKNSIVEYYEEEVSDDYIIEKANAVMDFCILRDALKTCLCNVDLGCEKINILHDFRCN